MSQTDPMLEIYIYENSTLIESLEEMLINAEKSESLSQEQIDEVFRIMHTIKGSSAMMNYDVIAKLAHSVEDLFAHIRERRPRTSDWERIFDYILNSTDFFKQEIAKIQNNQDPDGNATELINEILGYLDMLVNRAQKPAEEESVTVSTSDEDNELDFPGRFYKIHINFEKECKMENVRAFGVVNSISDICFKVAHDPKDLLEANDEDIAEHGFTLFVKTDADPEELKKQINQTLFLKSFSFDELPEDSDDLPASMRKVIAVVEQADSKNGAPAAQAPSGGATTSDLTLKQSFISVNINKLDTLLNLVGEIVTTESMVTRNPDLTGLQLENFEKQAQLLRKLTDELQDVVMSIRMIPVSSTFHKMKRIVRDMSKKVHKDVEMVLVGEETEVDKNIIDNLSDPLMHLVRNSMDHGLEMSADRVAAGKSETGNLTLEARNTGGDVIITLTDDGRGLDKEKILQKAMERGLVNKPESELTEREIYSFILLPGFSTKDQATEFSGRGVGMDVVRQNIDKIGGSMSLDSSPGRGMTVTIKIPLTLAIMDGMLVSVGSSIFIVPVLTIRESFKPQMKDVIVDPDGHEMIMIRGECYPILRLHEKFSIDTEITSFPDGIMVMVEADNATTCLFVDKLIGEQQAVIKPLPVFISQSMGNITGLSGCSIMGDGSISLILDVNSLLQ